MTKKTLFPMLIAITFNCYAEYSMTNSDCLITNSFKEANTATDNEKALVNNVVLNRVLLKKTNICKEVFAKNQFSWTKKKHRKFIFKDKYKMMEYYNIKYSNFRKLENIATQSLLNYSGDLVSNKSSSALMYHDKSIKHFPRINKSKIKLVLKDKHFLFYKTNYLNLAQN